MNRRILSITFLSFLWIQVIHGDSCASSECIHASAAILQRIDTKVDPCDNFYDFACGTFIEENYTPDESVAVDAFTKLKDTIDSEVYTLFNDAGDDETNATYKLSKELFRACMEKDRDTSEGDVKTLLEVIKNLGGWPLLEGASWDDDSKWSLPDTISNIRKLLGHRTNPIFDTSSFFKSSVDANNLSIRPSATFFSLRSAYYDYISNLVIFLGATTAASEREKELNHLLDFESKLNTIYRKYQQLSLSGDIKAQSDELLQNIFSIQWLEFFHPSQMKYIQDSKADDIKYATFVEEMKNLLNDTSKRTLANFVILQVVDSVAEQATGSLSDIYILLQRQVNGRQDRDQRWKECIDVLTTNIPYAIGDIYVKNFFKASTKEKATELFNEIKEEFLSLIAQADWIDGATKSKLLAKLISLVPLMAYPHDGFNEHSIDEFYDEVKVDKSQYLKTLFQLRVIDADNKFQQTYTPISSESSIWKKYLPPTSLTAFYSEPDNTIRFSAGIVQTVVFEAHTINYLEYGTVGFIIAHEISHIVNQIFNDATALSPGVQEEFKSKKQCLIEQYDQYQDPETSEYLNGKRTLAENIADNTGIKLAYRAYRKGSEKFTSKRLIGLDYSWDQLFWISAGQIWCGVYRPEETTRKIISDTYATERFRVIGSLSNSPDFARDFNCTQSSPMNRKNKCIIW